MAEDEVLTEDETHAPNAAVILNYSQTPVNYDAVPKVWLTHPDSTEEAPVLVPFTYGELVEGTKIVPDFSNGDMQISVPDGSLVKEATILKPDNLMPENIRQGVRICGIDGEFLGDTEELEVELSMAGGDQVILPSEDGKSLSKVTVKKPETLIPENIAKDVAIAGVVGTHEGSGSGGSADLCDVNLKYFQCHIDPTAGVITLHKIFYDLIYADTGSYDVTIPDTIGGMPVVIAAE